jgi:type I restriction enzyme S subunit
MNIENMVPRLRFPEFYKGWKNGKLNEIVTSMDSGWSPQCDEKAANIDEWGVLKTTAVTWIGFNETENKKLPKKLRPRKEIEIFATDILITRAGPTNRVGVIVHVDKVREKLMLSDKLIRIRLAKNNSKFFSILLGTEYCQKQIISKSSGLAASQTNISQKYLLNTKIKYPTILEQTKIASFLTSIDRRIQLLEEKKELLERYKKGIMQKLFSQEIRFKDENGNDFPDWEATNLALVFKSFKGKGLSKEKLDNNGNQKCILYGELFTTYTESINEISNRTNENEGTLSLVGDILVPASTTTSAIDLAKFTALNEKNIRLGGDITVLRANAPINNVFFAYYLSNFKKFEIAKYAQGTTIVHLYFSHFKKVKIHFPYLKEQNKIASTLQKLDELIQNVSFQIEKSREFKKGLLQKMFV